MRLIDADEIKYREQLEWFGNGRYEPMQFVYESDIDIQPTVDAAPATTGTWTVEHDPNDVPFMQTKYRCSACGGWNTYGKTKYCPNCGARMEEERDSDHAEEEIL